MILLVTCMIIILSEYIFISCQWLHYWVHGYTTEPGYTTGWLHYWVATLLSLVTLLGGYTTEPGYTTGWLHYWVATLLSLVTLLGGYTTG